MHDVNTMLQIGLCEQLISHLGKYRQQSEAQAPTAAPASSGSTNDAFQGMKAVKKRGDADPEEGFGGKDAPDAGTERCKRAALDARNDKSFNRDLVSCQQVELASHVAAFYGTGPKKAKGKKGKVPTVGQSSPTDQKLNHSLDIIDAFGKVKVCTDPP